MPDERPVGPELVTVRYLAPSAADMPIFEVFCQVMSVVCLSDGLLRHNDLGEPVPVDTRATISNVVLSSRRCGRWVLCRCRTSSSGLLAPVPLMRLSARRLCGGAWHRPSSCSAGDARRCRKAWGKQKRETATK